MTLPATMATQDRKTPGIERPERFAQAFLIRTRKLSNACGRHLRLGHQSLVYAAEALSHQLVDLAVEVVYLGSGNGRGD